MGILKVLERSRCWSDSSYVRSTFELGCWRPLNATKHGRHQINFKGRWLSQHLSSDDARPSTAWDKIFLYFLGRVSSTATILLHAFFVHKLRAIMSLNRNGKVLKEVKARVRVNGFQNQELHDAYCIFFKNPASKANLLSSTFDASIVSAKNPDE